MLAGKPDSRVTGFAVDSRLVKAGDVFFAIRGEKFDGHTFLPEAIRRGAIGVVVGDQSSIDFGDQSQEVPFVILVRDTTRALQLLARFIRRASGARVVAITGSVGKTTTKEIAATLLTSRYKVFRNIGNLNNHIGLPLSLLELRYRPEVAVVELGMNHPGEIRSLIEIAEPEVRVWTNVAPVHSAFFESVEAIADAKAEILEGATSTTLLVANASDSRVMARVSKFPGDIATFGIETNAEISATNVKSRGLRGMTAKMHTPVGLVDVRTSLLGEGNVANVLAAVAIALRFQVPLDVVLAGVTNFIAQSQRGNIVRVNGITIVDDTYNSNPAALKQVLQTLSFETGCGRRVAILGEMLELGKHAISLHESCGRAAVEAGFDRIIAVGGISAQALADGAIAAGLLPTSVTVLPTSQEAAQQISEIVQKRDLVLVKGSRGIKMDRIVDRLKSELGN
jgi:UDP-N-acetylmuramoyl-tripeptide--D-alanyl-D-alanine ligase